MNFKNLSTVNIYILSFLIMLFPLMQIVGNFAVNLIVVLICLLGLVQYREKIFDSFSIKSSLFIFLFFFILIVTTFFEENRGESNLLKSILYLRYFILLFVVKCMIENNHINVNRFLIFCAFICTVIYIDIIYQGMTGTNFFGLGSSGIGRHNSGIFGEELIAGSYLQKFSLLGLICVPYLFNILNKKKLLIVFLLLLIFFTGIMFTGNRMPFIMFVLVVLLMIVFVKRLRATLLIGSFFCVLLFISIFNFNEGMNSHYGEFYRSSIGTINNVKKFSFKEYPELEKRKFESFTKEYDIGKDSKLLKEKYELAGMQSGHQVVFLTALDIWNDNIFFGNGIKSFRYKCINKLHLPNRMCESHPHNYYLELLNDTGLLGTLILLVGILIILLPIIFNHKSFNSGDKIFLFCLIAILFAEFFPLKSSGSFFSTNNSSFIFFIMGILVGLKKKIKVLN